MRRAKLSVTNNIAERYGRFHYAYIFSIKKQKLNNSIT